MEEEKEELSKRGKDDTGEELGERGVGDGFCER